MGAMNNTPTMAEYAAANGYANIQSAAKRVQRAAKLPGFEHLQWSAGAPITDEVAAILSGKNPAKTKSVSDTNAARKVATRQTVVIAKTDSETEQHPTRQRQADDKDDDKAKTKTDKKKLWFWLVVAIPTAVSVGNIYAVSLSIMQGKIEAWLLTAVMSAMGPFLLWLDAKNKMVFALALGLIAFEAFANVARIYYGLMGSGANPVRFVGTVTDIFNSGTHSTALSLSIITSLFIGLVQYVGVSGLKR